MGLNCAIRKVDKTVTVLQTNIFGFAQTGMAKSLIPLACLLPLLALGCAAQNAMRQRRDVALLARDDAPRQPPTLPELVGPAFPDMLAGQPLLQVFSNPEDNRDGALALRD